MSLDFPTFRSLWQPACRVELDWERGCNDSWPVRLDVIEDRAELGKIITPWHHLEEDMGVNISGKIGGRATRLSEMNLLYPGLPAERIVEIAHYLEDFSSHCGTPVIPAAAMEFENGEMFLLDGTHHLSALMFAQIPFRVPLFVVYGVEDSGGWHIEKVRHQFS